MRSLSLGQKIWGVLGLLGLAFIVSAAFSTVKLREEKETVKFIAEKLIKQDQLTSDMDVNQRSMTTNVLEIIVNTDLSKMEKLTAKWEAASEKFKKSFDSYKLMADSRGRALADEYEKDFVLFLEASKTAKDFGVQNKDEEAAKALFSADEPRARMRKVMDNMNKLTADQLAEATKQAEVSADNAIVFQIIMALSSILGAGIIAFFVMRSVTKAIQHVVSGLSESSERVTSAAQQIAAASQELSSASTEQAAALVETASSTEEMSSMVSKNSDNAVSTAEFSNKSQSKASEGKSVVEEMLSSMSEIEKSNEEIMTEVNSSNQSMLEVVKLIEEIGSKTKVINDIVFQTKLLSFNASVEAARAGENGKGFAVVAEEVGTLAQMSGSAAKEISDLLSASISRVNELVSATKSSVEVKVAVGKSAVQNGNDVARRCSDVLDEIVENVSTTSKMATEISAASEEQSRGVNEITKAMSQLDQMTQQNTATSQECASAAADLSSQAEALKSLVYDLVDAVEGAKERKAELNAPREKSQVKRAANVIPMKQHKASVAPAPKAQFAKASGDGVPRHDDKGFKDI